MVIYIAAAAAPNYLLYILCNTTNLSVQWIEHLSVNEGDLYTMHSTQGLTNHKMEERPATRYSSIYTVPEALVLLFTIRELNCHFFLELCMHIYTYLSQHTSIISLR